MHRLLLLLLGFTVSVFCCEKNSVYIHNKTDKSLLLEFGPVFKLNTATNESIEGYAQIELPEPNREYLLIIDSENKQKTEHEAGQENKSASDHRFDYSQIKTLKVFSPQLTSNEISFKLGGRYVIETKKEKKESLVFYRLLNSLFRFYKSRETKPAT